MSKKDKIIEILKMLDSESKMPTVAEINLNKDEYGELFDSLLEEALISGIKPTRGGMGNKVLMLSLDRCKITVKGMDYLEENTKPKPPTQVEQVFKI